MKWPWMSREQHEETVSLWRQMADREHENAQTLRRELSDMTAKYHALKLQGATLPEPPAPVVQPIAIPVDPLRRAIRDQVRANPDIPGLGIYLTQFAAELRATEQADDQTIVRRLGQWESSEDWSSPVDSTIPDEAVA